MTVATVVAYFTASDGSEVQYAKPLARQKDIMPSGYFVAPPDEEWEVEPDNWTSRTVYRRRLFPQCSRMELIKIPLDPETYLAPRLDSIRIQHDLTPATALISVFGISVATDYVNWSLDLMGAFGQGAPYPQWGPRLINSNTVGKTMGSHGCAITSAAMLLRYLDIHDLDGSDMDPGRLLTLAESENSQGFCGVSGRVDLSWIWLQNFTLVSHNVNQVADPTAPEQPVLRLCTDPATRSEVRYEDIDSIEGNLAGGIPVVLQVRTTGNHFVLAGDVRQTLTPGAPSESEDPDHYRGTYGLLDPAGATGSRRELMYYRQDGTLPADDDANPRNRFVAARLYRVTNPAETDFSWLFITAESPVEMVLTDPLSRKCGYDPRTGTAYAQIPDAEYARLDDMGCPVEGTEWPLVLSVRTPVDGGYQLEVIATSATGEYTLTRQYSEADATIPPPVTYSAVPITQLHQVDVYLMNLVKSTETDNTAPTTHHNYRFAGKWVRECDATLNLWGEDLQSGVRSTHWSVDGGSYASATG